jgi:Zn finger protein HypA/HybF involved in hydrogenase expression
MFNDEKRGVEEAYTSASTSSNLRVEADRPGDADVIIAAGWNQSRIGAALLRLHTEFDASERLRLATADQFLPAGKTSKEQRTAAATQAFAFNLHETGLLLGKLKSLPDVRAQAMIQAMKWGFGRPQDPVTCSERTEAREHDAALLKRLREEVAKAGDDERALAMANATLVITSEEVEGRRKVEEEEDVARCGEKVASVIRWWLSQRCPACSGTKFQVVEGTNRHGAKICRPCGGTGLREVPHQQQGRRLACWFDQCVERARASIGRRLRSVD